MAGVFLGSTITKMDQQYLILMPVYVAIKLSFQLTNKDCINTTIKRFFSIFELWSLRCVAAIVSAMLEDSESRYLVTLIYHYPIVEV